MSRLPPLTELRAFEAAARHLSFKRAAADLGVTPTAVSHQIRLLETHCGRQLFRRQPRPLSLTSEGARLYPVVRDGFQRIAATLESIRPATPSSRLRVTATNAFAARWLVPRLPLWRRAHSRRTLDIIGTDAVLDLAAGEADVAIRYARKAPAGTRAVELMRDRHHVVASPRLIGSRARPLSPTEIAGLPLIECEWPQGSVAPPMWPTWRAAARRRHGAAPDVTRSIALTFREELHGIEAAIAGHGVALCSDLLVADELASGALVIVSDVTLPGYGFYLVPAPSRKHDAQIRAFTEWIRGLAQRGKSPMT